MDEEREVTTGTAATQGPKTLPFINAFHIDFKPKSQELLATLQDVYQITLLSIQPGIGAYLGPVEPALIVTFSGNVQRIIGAMCDWAKCYDQEAIRYYQLIEGGRDFKYEIELSRPLTDQEALEAIRIIERRRLSGTLWQNDEQKIIRAEYWGKCHTDEEKQEARNDALLLSYAFPEEIRSSKFTEGYEIEDIYAVDFDKYIDQCGIGRAIERGACLE